MKKVLTLVGAGVLAAGIAQPAKAADLDVQPVVQQLVVSGVVESWFGYTLYSDVDVDSDDPSDHFAGGRSGRLSLPLGSNLSLQMDFDNETNTDWLVDGDDNDDNAFNYSFQGLVHLSWRDPSTGLFGAFGAAGRGAADNQSYSLYVIGGEGQLYFGDWTLYGQGGYLDSEESDNDGMSDTAFGRGVVRWFTTENSRLQAEASYGDGIVDGNDDGHLIEWAARYDTVLGLPVVGDANVFVGYRGAHFKNEDENDSYTDHTFMAGFRMWFGGNTMLEFDRVGATLDAPNFGRWVGAGNIID